MQYSLPTTHNFSKQLIYQQKLLCKQRVLKQMEKVQDPFNSSQISLALRNLENQKQRKQLLDSIIRLRESKKQEEERVKQQQLQKLLQKANHTNSHKLNTDYIYHRDLEDFESIKVQRYRFESERIENFYQRNDQHHLHRVSSLNCLTTDFERKVPRKVKRNITLLRIGRSTPQDQ